MNSEKKNRTLAVVGAGPGGYAAAFMAADQGLEVTLIDPEPNPGGTCLYHGCIPTKALLHAARVIFETKRSKDIGLVFQDPDIDIKQLRSWKDKTVEKLTSGVGFLNKQRKIRYIRGKAVFKEATRLRIDKHDGNAAEESFDAVILATGSSPTTLPGADFSHPGIWDSRQALQLETVPETMLIIGGGYIGLEMATIYHSLGTRIWLAEMTADLLPGADRDLVSVYKKEGKNLFESIMLETRVEDIREQDQGMQVTFKKKGEDSTQQVFETILAAVGRNPNTRGLGLENTGVEKDDRDFITVNAGRQTTDPAIFAIGDITGGPLLAHKATHEGRVAARVISGQKAAYDPRAVPAVLYTDPEIAWCGLTQAQAEEQGKKVEIAKFPWNASGRAATLNRKHGITKLVLEPDNGRILGVALVGPHAGELISEGVLAVEMGAVAEDIALSIHPHPTLSETLMEAAQAFYAESTHYLGKKK